MYYTKNELYVISNFIATNQAQPDLSITDGNITFNFSDQGFDEYNETQKEYLRGAIDRIEATTGLTIEETSTVSYSQDHIQFVRWDDGTTVHNSTNFTHYDIYISPGDILTDDYSEDSLVTQHEILHALGLFHPGNYNSNNGTRTYDLDSSQISMVSYYSPDGSPFQPSVYLLDNPNIDGSYIEAYTPMLADLYAIELIYGRENTLDNVNVGDTIHKIPDDILNDPWGITITDLGEGETDVINLLNTTNDNILYLEPGYGSSLDGRDYNFFIYWDSKIENVIGSNQNDTVYGNELDNHISGAIGHDVIFGQGGSDTLYGDAGDDRLYGGIATDTNNNGIFGEVYIDGNGNEVHETANLHYSDTANAAVTIYGGSGNDYIVGARKQDTLYGGADNDTIIGSVAKDYIYGDDANSALEGNDLLFGQGGGDFIYGGKGDDKINGGSGHDRLYGGNNTDVLMGESGNDKLYGDYGDDVISGGEGNDYIKGGANNDWIMGNEGTDTLFGGSGADVFYFREPDGSDTIMDFGTGDVLEFEFELLQYTDQFGQLYVPTEQEFLSSGNITTGNGNTYIAFENGHTLTLDGYTGGLSTANIDINYDGIPNTIEMMFFDLI